MNDYSSEMGFRLRKIRENFILPGVKLSANQFAKMLDSTADKILNYERGLSNVPNSILIRLYYLGINPVYILTGEEYVFANNESGKRLNQKCEQVSKVNILSNRQDSDKKFKIIKAAAKDLRKKK